MEGSTMLFKNIDVTFTAHKSEGGKKMVHGIASDTLVDLANERFSKSALDMMKSSIDGGAVVLLPTHWSTFHIGKAVQADVKQKYDDVHELGVWFELNMDYPEARDLYAEVSGTAKDKVNTKMMSIGGYISADDSEDAVTRDEIETEEGGKYAVTTIHKLTLDHVAVTRSSPIHTACNQRTEWDAVKDNALGTNAFIMCHSNDANCEYKLVDTGVAGVQSAITRNGEAREIGLVFCKSNGWTHDNAAAYMKALDKAVVPPHRTSKASNDDMPWAWTTEAQDEILQRGGWRMYRTAHVWYDADKPEIKASYKLPHHKYIDGGLKVVRRGVIAATVRLSSTEMPEGDRRAAAEHLRTHYDQFDMEFPKSTSLEDVLSAHKTDLADIIALCVTGAFGEYGETVYRAICEIQSNEREPETVLGKIANMIRSIGKGAAGDETADSNPSEPVTKAAGNDLSYYVGELQAVAEKLTSIVSEMVSDAVAEPVSDDEGDEGDGDDTAEKNTGDDTAGETTTAEPEGTPIAKEDFNVSEQKDGIDAAVVEKAAEQKEVAKTTEPTTDAPKEAQAVAKVDAQPSEMDVVKGMLERLVAGMDKLAQRVNDMEKAAADAPVEPVKQTAEKTTDVAGHAPVKAEKDNSGVRFIAECLLSTRAKYGE